MVDMMVTLQIIDIASDVGVLWIAMAFGTFHFHTF
jgi:hypothetical protein